MQRYGFLFQDVGSGDLTALVEIRDIIMGTLLKNK